MESHYILLIFTLIGITIGQVTQPGRCPNIPTIQNFNLYQVSKTANIVLYRGLSDINSFLAPYN